GDPTGLERMLDLVGRRQEAAPLATLGAEAEGFWLSVWGVFGGFDVLAEPWVYRLYGGLAVLAGVGLGVTAAGRAVLSRTVDGGRWTVARGKAGSPLSLWKRVWQGAPPARRPPTVHRPPSTVPASADVALRPWALALAAAWALLVFAALVRW